MSNQPSDYTQYPTEPAMPPVVATLREERGPLPVLPYAGSSGHSGSETSAERAHHQDTTGITAKRQHITLTNVENFKADGLTVVELRTLTGWHHGQASSALSALHKSGHLVRLVETRGAGKGRRCHVYVVPEYVNGRDTQPHGRSVTEGEQSRQFQAGFQAGQADLTRRIISVMNRNPMAGDTRAFRDLRALLERDD